MSVSTVRASVQNLMFHLFRRSVHPELFEVFAVREIEQEAFEAVIRICEAGHMISFRADGETVTELTANVDQPLPRRRHALRKRIRGSRDESIELGRGLRYHASFQLEQLDPQVFQNFHEELLVDCGRVEVAHRFPPGNRLTPEPLSVIRAHSEPRSLLIHAYHTFPESCAVVKTQSLFEMKPHTSDRGGRHAGPFSEAGGDGGRAAHRRSAGVPGRGDSFATRRKREAPGIQPAGRCGWRH